MTLLEAFNKMFERARDGVMGCLAGPGIQHNTIAHHISGPKGRAATAGVVVFVGERACREMEAVITEVNRRLTEEAAGDPNKVVREIRFDRPPTT